MNSAAGQHRVQFDFELTFSNGGGLQGQGFRLDIEGDEISDEALAEYIVRDLRLLMVDRVRIVRKEILEEAHKRTAGARAQVTSTGGRAAGDSVRFVDLSHTVEHGMVTYKGLPEPVICEFLSRRKSRSRYAPGTEFQIGLIEMVGNTGTYLDSPFHRLEDGVDLAGLDLHSLAELEGVVVRVAGQRERAIGRMALLAFEKEALAGRAVHTRLLGAGIPIVEHLCDLDELPVEGFRFSAVPVKVHGMGSFPVRAYARLLK